MTFGQLPYTSKNLVTSWHFLAELS